MYVLPNIQSNIELDDDIRVMRVALIKVPSVTIKAFYKESISYAQSSLPRYILSLQFLVAQYMGHYIPTCSLALTCGIILSQNKFNWVTQSIWAVGAANKWNDVCPNTVSKHTTQNQLTISEVINLSLQVLFVLCVRLYISTITNNYKSCGQIYLLLTFLSFRYKSKLYNVTISILIKTLVWYDFALLIILQ